VNISNHGWIEILEYLYNGVLRKSRKVVIIRFGCTLLVKYGDLYSIHLLNDKRIVVSSCGR
jgi:hypothetical protein